MSRQTLHRMMRTFVPVKNGNGETIALEKRGTIQEPMDQSIIPCLQCGEYKVRQAYGQVVRFCSKECKKNFKHGY